MSLIGLVELEYYLSDVLGRRVGLAVPAHLPPTAPGPGPQRIGRGRKTPHPLLNSLAGRQVDGIIWAVPEIGTNRSWLKDQPHAFAAPLIFLTMGARPALSSVSIDNYQGGCLATEHLLAQGYQYIGHVSGPRDW
jgi:hypothetical protein